MGVIVVKPKFLLVFNHLETVHYIQHCERGIYSFKSYCMLANCLVSFLSELLQIGNSNAYNGANPFSIGLNGTDPSEHVFDPLALKNSYLGSDKEINQNSIKVCFSCFAKITFCVV